MTTVSPRLVPSMAGPPSSVRILLCDDNELVREGMRAVLGGALGLEVVAEAGSAAAALEGAERERPDVVIMDVRLPDGSGVDACRAIREVLPATKVIMLTSLPDEEALYASVLAGASGYLLKQTRARALLKAIETVVEGRGLLDPLVVARVLETFRRARADRDPALAALTDPERAVLAELSTGKMDHEIAVALSLADKTVRNYVSRILDKLGLHARA